MSLYISADLPEPLLLGQTQSMEIDWCYLLIPFANSLDPNQARQNVGPVLDPNCLTF